MERIHTIRVGEQEYALQDTLAARIDDTATTPDKTWSAEKLSAQLGDISGALSGILALQQQWMGGGAA